MPCLCLVAVKAVTAFKVAGRGGRFYQSGHLPHKNTSFANYISGDCVKFKDYLMCFGVGAILYGLIEVVSRGYTHWTMALTGGAVLMLLNLINQTSNLNILLKCFLGMVVITSLEFAVGMAVNVGFGWNVWDYSDKPLNIWGQICPQFFLVWFLLSVPAFALCSFIESRFSLRQRNF